MNIHNLCPVCGFEMEAPPKDYRICRSCGTEFGIHDVNATIAQLRQAWLKTGPKWWSKTNQQPAQWDPIAQLERITEIQPLKPAASVVVVTLTDLSWEVKPRLTIGFEPSETSATF